MKPKSSYPVKKQLQTNLLLTDKRSCLQAMKPRSSSMATDEREKLQIPSVFKRKSLKRSLKKIQPLRINKYYSRIF